MHIGHPRYMRLGGIVIFAPGLSSPASLSARFSGLGTLSARGEMAPASWATDGDVSSPELAGRESELEVLRAALTAAEGERPSLVLLTGDAGLGKTRLTRELEGNARDSGVLTLRGQCLELSVGELPYAPIAAALRAADPESLADGLSRLPIDARRELARAFPDAVGEAPAETNTDDRFGQSRLFGWILGLLRNLSSSLPVLLTIEDVHLADTSSRDFLRFLAQSLRSERLLTVATIRSDELHREHPVRALIAELQRYDRVTRVELLPLSPDAVRSQVEAIIGSPPAPELLRRLVARGQGNPLYTEELLAAGEAEPDAIPETLRDALLLRADRLDEPGRQVLRLLSTAGRPVDGTLIEVASELPRQELERALRQCIDQNVLVCDRRTGYYSVRHALVAEVVYDDLLPVERTVLHGRIAGALSRTPSEETAAERAHHWERAGEPAHALAASVQAGLAAEAVFGYGEALSHFQRAVELWRKAPPDPASSRLDLVDLLARAAQAARWMGESEQASELCQRALDTVDHEADPLRAAALYERLGRYRPWDTDASLTAYDRGLGLISDRNPTQRMRFMVGQALAFSFEGRWLQARDKAAEAILLADGEDTLATEGSARALLGTSMAFLGDPVAGEQQLRDALVLARRSGSTEDLVQIYLDLGEVLRLEGRIEEAFGLMLEGEQAASRLGAAPYENFMAANAADDLLKLGRWGELETRLAELAERNLHRPAELWTKSVAGRLYSARGRFEAAAAEFESAAELCEALDLPEFVPAVYGGYAELELWRGRPDTALAHLNTGFGKLGAGENLLHIPGLHSVGARAEADAAELALARKDSASAERAVERARGHHDRLTELLSASADGVTPPEASAHLATCAAELTRAVRRPDADRWAAAASSWRAHHNPYRVAYCELRRAEALVASRGSRPDARSALETAVALSGELGAEPMLEAVRALARRARLTLEAPRAAVPTTPPGSVDAHGIESEANPFGLTARELEVLRLLGAGLTNREISQALFISQHTAGVHVSHILGKLGVANRVMAAAVAERMGLAAES
jgi:DNA-binding CsgD family transcriptional regulator/tetratricopeptide (TPR) repeat protein